MKLAAIFALAAALIALGAWTGTGGVIFIGTAVALGGVLQIRI